MSTFSYTPKNPLPPLGTIKTEWDLKRHFYTSAKDPAIEQNVVATEQAYAAFAKKYKNKDFTKDPETLSKALADYDVLSALPSSKPLLYFFYRSTLNSHDDEAERHSNLISDRLTKAGNLVLFFYLQIGKIPKSKQAAFLKHPTLQAHRYDLENTFKHAHYNLTEAEERILNLKSAPARGLWINGTDKIMTKRSVTFKNKTIPLMEAIENVGSITPADRPGLWKVITAELKQLSEIAENEMNAIVIDKKINDELRGFTTAYESKVLGNENDVKSVEALVESIKTEGFALSRKFYKIKAKLHGKTTIPYAARYDPIGKEPVIPFTQAVEICRDVFYGVRPEYGAFFDEMLTSGRIDVYPKPNRSGGAFMSSDVGAPTMVFLNHTDNFKTLETLAHEMGHALHSSRSKARQPVWYEQYSTTTAETASTLFENLVFEAVYEQSDTTTKRTLMHDRILRDISTIQRQIAFFEYERIIHERIRTEGMLTKESLAQEFTKQLRAHLGPAVTIDEDDGYSFVYVGHFRSMFYVYTYAYGLLMSNIMSKAYKADPSYVAKIDQFLSSGGNNTVENIFKTIGINTHKIETFTDSLASLKTNIAEFNKLTK